jgi:hypothetical protein
MAIYCPSCRRTDTIRKSSAIVAKGTWSGSAYGGPYLGSYSTTNRTQLVANLLANEPRRKQVFGCASWLALLFLGAIGLISCYAAGFGAYNATPLLIGGLIGVLICGGSSILLIITAAIRSARNSRQWTINHALWEQDFERQYYCSQCYRVFYV